MKKADPRRGRKVKLLNINGGNVITVLDLGVTRDGTPTGQRQHLMRVLSKHTTINGQRYATFRLAEPPEEFFSEFDSFDDQFLRPGGNWATPSKEWLAERERQMAAAAAHIEEADARLATRIGGDIAASVGALVAQAQKAQPAAPRSK